MASERQKLANQRNAQLSTVPRSAAGKAISSQNHRIHGFSSKIAVLTEPEDREIFNSRLQEYLPAYGNGKPVDILRAFTAVNAEFQFIHINRARKAYTSFTRERAIDQLWGSQPMPEDPETAYEVNTKLTGYAVMRDFSEHDILLKMNRYEREQIRSVDRAVQLLERNYDRVTAKSGGLSPEDHDKVRQAIETFYQNSTPIEADPCVSTTTPGKPSAGPDRRPATRPIGHRVPTRCYRNRSR
jgi:hypothetical protein